MGRCMVKEDPAVLTLTICHLITPCKMLYAVKLNMPACERPANKVSSEPV